MIDQLIGTQNLKTNKVILVGVISKAHGIKGYVVIKSYTQPAENIVKLPIFDQNNIKIDLKIIRISSNGNLICSLKGCNDRNMAESLVKKSLFCLRSDLPEITQEDEFYIEDLIGLTILDSDKQQIGQVLNVANYGGGNIIEIKLASEKQSQMIPFTKEFFPEITQNFIVLAKKY